LRYEFLKFKKQIALYSISNQPLWGCINRLQLFDWKKRGALNSHTRFNFSSNAPIYLCD